jgi:hypothetical protein
MVFAPTRDVSVGEHEPSASPKRRDHVEAPSGGGERLPWRAVVHVSDRDAVHTTWHIAGCAAPVQADAHCPEGQKLIETLGDPDGHCLLDGQCARCEQVAHLQI